MKVRLRAVGECPQLAQPRPSKMRCPHGVAGGASLERLENRDVPNPDRRTGAFLGASSWLALLDLRSPPKNSCARAPVFWDSFPETEHFRN